LWRVQSGPLFHGARCREQKGKVHAGPRHLAYPRRNGIALLSFACLPKTIGEGGGGGTGHPTELKADKWGTTGLSGQRRGRPAGHFVAGLGRGKGKLLIDLPSGVGQAKAPMINGTHSTIWKSAGKPNWGAGAAGLRHQKKKHKHSSFRKSRFVEGGAGAIS